MRLRLALLAVPLALAFATGTAAPSSQAVVPAQTVQAQAVPHTLSWVSGNRCNFDLFHYASLTVERDVIGTSVKAFRLSIATKEDVYQARFYERRGQTVIHSGEYYGPLTPYGLTPITRLPYMEKDEYRYAEVELWAPGKHCHRSVLIAGRG